MAIVAENTSNGTVSGAELTVEHICTGTESDGIIVITVQVTDSVLSDRTISGVTHNAEVCTHLVGADSDDGVEARSEIWYRKNPTTGGTPDIVVTAGGKATDLSLGAVSFTGVDTNFGVMDFYDLANQSSVGQMYNGGVTGRGQSFTGDGGEVQTVVFQLQKTLNPTGNAVAKLYTHTGVFGTSSVPGSLLATSDNVDVSTINTSLELVTFNFTTPYTTTDGTKYCIAVEYSGGDSSNRINVGRDGSSPTHAGNGFDYDGGWTAVDSIDYIFYVYESPLATATGDSTVPTLDITTVGTSSFVVDSLSSRESAGAKIATSTPGGVVIHKTDVGADTHAATYVDAGTAGSQTMSYSDDDADTVWVMSAVAVTIAVGGTFEVSITDGIELDDTSSETMAAVPTITDGVKGGDTNAELSSMEVAVTDGTKLGDTALGVILSFLSVTDGIKLGDTTLEDMVASPIVTDGFKGGDSRTSGGVMDVASSDGIEIGDAPSIMLLYLLSVIDGLKLGDSRSQISTMNVSIVDGVKGGDTTSELGTMEALVSDGVKLGDTTIGALLLLLSLADGLKAGDTVTETMATDSIITDGVKLGDTPLVGMSSIITVTDGIKLGDTPLENILAVVSVTDGMKVGDATVNVLIVYPVVTDGAIFGDTVLIELVSGAFEVSVTDGVKIGDAPVGEMATFTVISDGIKIGDISIVEMSSNVSVNDGVKLGDITVGNITYSVVVSDGFKIGDLTTGTLTLAPRGSKDLRQSKQLRLYLRMIDQMSKRRI